jgi:hypothetical protein
MVSVPVQCPHCQSTAVIKAGKQANGRPNVISVKTRSAYGGSFSCHTRVAAAHVRFIATWLTCPSTGVAFTIRPAYYGLAPRP